MNVLVTGGNGYVGKGMASHLGKLGVFCYAYDMKDNADIFDETHLLNEMKGKDAVIHLAGLRGPDCDLEGAKPEDYERINYGGSKTVLKVAKMAGIKRFAFASSIEVYGFPSMLVPYVKQCELPITDETPIPTENHPYALMKLKTEAYFRAAAPKYEMTIVALRFGGIESTSPWGITWGNLAKAFYYALTTDKVKEFDYCPVCDPGKEGIDLSRACTVLGKDYIYA